MPVFEFPIVQSCVTFLENSKYRATPDYITILSGNIWRFLQQYVLISITIDLWHDIVVITIYLKILSWIWNLNLILSRSNPKLDTWLDMSPYFALLLLLWFYVGVPNFQMNRGERAYYLKRPSHQTFLAIVHCCMLWCNLATV